MPPFLRSLQPWTVRHRGLSLLSALMVHSNLPCWLKWMCGDPRKKATAQPDPRQHLLVALTWAGSHRAPAARPCPSPRSTPLFSGTAGGHQLLHCMWESGPLSWFSPWQLSLRAWGKLETNREDNALTERHSEGTH